MKQRQHTSETVSVAGKIGCDDRVIFPPLNVSILKIGHPESDDTSGTYILSRSPEKQPSPKIGVEERFIPQYKLKEVPEKVGFSQDNIKSRTSLLALMRDHQEGDIMDAQSKSKSNFGGRGEASAVGTSPLAKKALERAAIADGGYQSSSHKNSIDDNNNQTNESRVLSDELRRKRSADALLVAELQKQMAEKKVRDEMEKRVAAVATIKHFKNSPLTAVSFVDPRLESAARGGHVASLIPEGTTATSAAVTGTTSATLLIRAGGNANYNRNSRRRRIDTFPIEDVNKEGERDDTSDVIDLFHGTSQNMDVVNPDSPTSVNNSVASQTLDLTPESTSLSTRSVSPPVEIDRHQIALEAEKQAYLEHTERRRKEEEESRRRRSSGKVNSNNDGAMNAEHSTNHESPSRLSKNAILEYNRQVVAAAAAATISHNSLAPKSGSVVHGLGPSTSLSTHSVSPPVEIDRHQIALEAEKQAYLEHTERRRKEEEESRRRQSSGKVNSNNDGAMNAEHSTNHESPSRLSKNAILEYNRQVVATAAAESALSNNFESKFPSFRVSDHHNSINSDLMHPTSISNLNDSSSSSQQQHRQQRGITKQFNLVVNVEKQEAYRLELLRQMEEISDRQRKEKQSRIEEDRKEMARIAIAVESEKKGERRSMSPYAIRSPVLQSVCPLDERRFSISLSQMSPENPSYNIFKKDEKQKLQETLREQIKDREKQRQEDLKRRRHEEMMEDRRIQKDREEIREREGFNNKSATMQTNKTHSNDSTKRSSMAPNESNITQTLTTESLSIEDIHSSSHLDLAEVFIRSMTADDIDSYNFDHSRQHRRHNTKRFENINITNSSVTNNLMITSNPSSMPAGMCYACDTLPAMSIFVPKTASPMQAFAMANLSLGLHFAVPITSSMKYDMMVDDGGGAGSIADISDKLNSQGVCDRFDYRPLSRDEHRPNVIYDDDEFRLNSISSSGVPFTQERVPFVDEESDDDDYSGSSDNM